MSDPVVPSQDLVAPAPPADPPIVRARFIPPGRKGGFGRQKGTPNKLTVYRAALARFINDPAYQNNLMARIESGQAPHMELFFHKILYDGRGLNDGGVRVSVQRAVVLYLPRNGREVDARPSRPKPKGRASAATVAALVDKVR